jgi:hypothetical protein
VNISTGISSFLCWIDQSLFASRKNAAYLRRKVGTTFLNRDKMLHLWIISR